MFLQNEVSILIVLFELIKLILQFIRFVARRLFFFSSRFFCFCSGGYFLLFFVVFSQQILEFLCVLAKLGGDSTRELSIGYYHLERLVFQ